jgi:hypothetical protein
VIKKEIMRSMRPASIFVVFLELFAWAGAAKRKRCAQVGGQIISVDAEAVAAATAAVATTGTGTVVATSPEMALASPCHADVEFRIGASDVTYGGFANIDR